MTREEAKEILTHNWTRVDNPNYSESELDEVVDMAIEALTQDSRKVTQAFTHTLPDGTEILIDEESYEIGYTHGQMTDRPDMSEYADKLWKIAYERGKTSVESADRPTGEWVECESNHIEKIYLCSNCQNYEAWGETEKTPYCPNCGAKMNKGGDSE